MQIPAAIIFAESDMILNRTVSPPSLPIILVTSDLNAAFVLKGCKSSAFLKHMEDHSTWNNTRYARHAVTVLQAMPTFQ